MIKRSVISSQDTPPERVASSSPGCKQAAGSGQADVEILADDAMLRLTRVAERQLSALPLQG